MLDTEIRRIGDRPSLLPETRSYHVSRVSCRAADDPAMSSLALFTGYATVTEVGYDIYGGPDEGGWTEYVSFGAFTKTLSEKPDVNFVINHVGMSLARTKSGTLRITEDVVGLAVSADLDRRQSAVNDLVIGMERGDIDEMSFKFRVIRDKWLTADGVEVPWWDLDGIKRYITEVSLHKGDVSAVNYGANPNTSADLRALDGALAAVRCGRPLTESQRVAISSRLGDDAGRNQGRPTPPEPELIKSRGMSLSAARVLSAQ